MKRLNGDFGMWSSTRVSVWYRIILSSGVKGPYKHIKLAISFVWSPRATGGGGGVTQIYSCTFIHSAMSDEYFKQRAFKQGKGEGGVWGGEFPNDCKNATGRELSIFLLPRQICLHIFLLCLRTLLRQRTAIEIFWQAALCFHFHKRCSGGVKEREKREGEDSGESHRVGKVKGCCQRLGAFTKTKGGGEELEGRGKRGGEQKDESEKWGKKSRTSGRK